jgi:myo-inositol-1-phosphate synthase
MSTWDPAILSRGLKTANSATSAWKAPPLGGVPLNCELKLEVWDSPNSAGVVIDAVRCAKLAMDRGIGGALESASSYFMKSPPRQFSDDEARQKTEAFIDGREPR